MMNNDNIARAKEVSMVSLLESFGFKPYQEYKYRAIYLSPIRGEKEPSFIVYKGTNTFYDFGTGNQGDNITLVQLLTPQSFLEAIESILSKANLPIVREIKEPERKKFKQEDYVTTIKKEVELIHSYAMMRRVSARYINGAFSSKLADGSYIRTPSMMFLHRDKNNQKKWQPY